ncbi:hypothetical protein ANN_09296 [Periplaneta americana]|uniref:Uncharacterized protein n=1 Tax=Periplaneta americana TaxID=6978 RepID=A0ABQ8TMQ4_PERAM|nr:hypothetical protein ANN_09296 [Periplaneta americana]
MVEENKTKWKDHVDRMAENRLPKKIMNYRPIGKRDLGRPRKRWLDDRDRNSREVVINIENEFTTLYQHLGYLASEWNEGDNAGEMSPESSTESYPAFARIALRENPGKNVNQVTCPDRDWNPGHLVSRPDALTVTPQVWTLIWKERVCVYIRRRYRSQLQWQQKLTDWILYSRTHCRNVSVGKVKCEYLTFAAVWAARLTTYYGWQIADVMCIGDATILSYTFNRCSQTVHCTQGYAPETLASAMSKPTKSQNLIK